MQISKSYNDSSASFYCTGYNNAPAAPAPSVSAAAAAAASGFWARAYSQRLWARHLLTLLTADAWPASIFSRR